MQDIPSKVCVYIELEATVAHPNWCVNQTNFFFTVYILLPQPYVKRLGGRYFVPPSRRRVRCGLPRPDQTLRRPDRLAMHARFALGELHHQRCPISIYIYIALARGEWAYVIELPGRCGFSCACSTRSPSRQNVRRGC